MVDKFGVVGLLLGNLEDFGFELLGVASQDGRLHFGHLGVEDLFGRRQVFEAIPEEDSFDVGPGESSVHVGLVYSGSQPTEHEEADIEEKKSLEPVVFLGAGEELGDYFVGLVLEG